MSRRAKKLGILGTSKKEETKHCSSQALPKRGPAAFHSCDVASPCRPKLPSCVPSHQFTWNQTGTRSLSKEIGPKQDSPSVRFHVDWWEGNLAMSLPTCSGTYGQLLPSIGRRLQRFQRVRSSVRQSQFRGFKKEVWKQNYAQVSHTQNPEIKMDYPNQSKNYEGGRTKFSSRIIPYPATTAPSHRSFQTHPLWFPFGALTQLFSDPGKKREPFLGKTFFSGAATKNRGKKGATAQLS